MTTYFSPSREVAEDWRRRQAVAERLRYWTRDQVAVELARPAGNPPLYLQLAREHRHLDLGAGEDRG